MSNRDRSGGRALDTLLTYNESWKGRSPLYGRLRAEPIPRVGADGHVYVGFPAAFEIWKVHGPGAYSRVVRGCVPEVLIEGYREPYSFLPSEAKIRRFVDMITDFAVFANGTIVVLRAFRDEEGHAAWLFFDRTGTLLRSWHLGPPDRLHARAKMNPRNPREILTYWASVGHTVLLRLEGTGR